MKFTLAIITAALLVPGSVPPVNADTHIPDVTWTTLYFRQGILVEKGTVADSPYHALRGTGIVQAGIGRVISILYEHNRAKEWVHQLVKSKGLRNDLLSSVVWQRYDIPWPAKDRDFVYLAEPAIDESRKFFQALMTDVTEINNRLTNAERTGLPNQSCCVRGKIVYGRWQFRPVEPGKTCARIDIINCLANELSNGMKPSLTYPDRWQAPLMCPPVHWLRRNRNRKVHVPNLVR